MRHPDIIKIGEACEILGVHPNTLRNWEAEGKIKPLVRTMGKGTRYYSRQDLIEFMNQSSTRGTGEFVTLEALSKEYGVDLTPFKGMMGESHYDRRIVDGLAELFKEFAESQKL